MAEDKLNCYFFRRELPCIGGIQCPKLMLSISITVLVTEENVRNSSYYMIERVLRRLYGYSVNKTSSGEHTILFSVWSPYSH